MIKTGKSSSVVYFTCQGFYQSNFIYFGILDKLLCVYAYDF